MSTITDKKITDGQRDAVWVQHQQDRLTGTPQQNKAVFDEYAELIRGNFNEALDIIEERISTNDSDIEHLKETDAGEAATSARESAASASESAQATQGMLGRVISISNKIYMKSWDVEQEQDEFVFTAEGYTYNESDTYEVFVNGLKLSESEYTRNEDSVVLGSSISAGNTVEIIVTTNLKGKGIADTELNDDYTLTINYDDGTSMTTESIRGEKGEKGDKGDGVYDDTQVKNDIAVLDSRVDSFTHLTEGSTTGDAELIDARIGADGTTYSNAGDAVRGQVSDLKSDYDDLVGYNNGNGSLKLGHTFVRGYISGGNILPIGYRVVSQDILVYDHNIELTIASGFRVGIHKYKWNDTYLINEGWKTGTYFIPAYTKFRAEIARVTENTSETADISNFVSQLSFTSAIAYELDAVKDNDFIQSYAHKGYALTAPECTASAYIEAKRRGYSGAECDIQVTSDGKFVIWHDGTLGKLGYGNPISNYTLAQLQAFDFGSWKSTKYAGEKILTFDEFVLLCKKLGLQILIDTKFEYSEAQITELANTVNKYGMMGNAIWYINFNGSYLAKLKQLYPKARIAWIGTATEARCEIVKHQLVDGVDYSVCLVPAITDLTAEDVERAHSYGISAGCYTSVDFDSLDASALKTAMLNAIDMGIDLIVSDVYRAKDIADEELLLQ